ncbi:transcription initiation factor TFIID subunit 6-like [Eurytemora carolleeae]|uniref:transcription initiation factor TFIID subunit 6-like n=1 Tax=Eurytemora carolleeae TaxID=1294199 RepID=UPI000C76F7A0|nr:transcription initiation factor TFIID subunit 6-like [Eurytemora carolleeae]|eukprot:XP_023337419.1 transcription initiation factor TFIID subunit 6-like [Eurytemora affinis]
MMNMMEDSQHEVGLGGVKSEPIEVDHQVEDTVGVSTETIKIIADTLGMPGLPEDACRELSEEVTYRLRMLTQNAQKFMNHGRRTKMFCDDIDHALKLQGQEPLYGFQAQEHIPFRFSSGGGRDLHFLEDKEIDLNELVNNQLPKIPMAPSLRAHWLAIDGIQPAIPENPPPQSKDQLITDSVDPAAKLKSGDAKDNKLGAVLGQAKMKTVETVNVKQLASHELSVEQQLYFKEITEACVGSDEPRRAEALQSLACDPGLHQMLPRLATFIAEGVRVNVVQHNLAILIYLMRMVKSLLENQTLYLEKYLHELIPAVATCIVSRQLCSRPDHDNHWALRDFASRMMAAICKNFHTSTNNIQTRVTKMFSDALKSERAPLVSYYGAIAGLQELGPDVIKVFILPYISILAAKIDAALDSNNSNLATSSVEKIAAQNIRTLLVKSVSPVLKSLRDPPDYIEDYRLEFGSLGQPLHTGVERARKQSGNKSSGLASTPARLPSLTTPTARPPQPSNASQQKVFIVNQQQQQGQPSQQLQQVQQLQVQQLQGIQSPQVRTVVLQDGNQTPHRPNPTQQIGVRSVFQQNPFP